MAVIIKSASRILPDFKAIPVSVNLSIVSVSTVALPDFRTLKKSASGTRHSL